MPNICPIKFIKKVLVGDKYLLTNKEIISYSCKIPVFEEISIRFLWNKYQEDYYFIAFFPDYPEN